jgi:hypothetical protein
MSISFVIGLVLSMLILCFTLLVMNGFIRIPPFDINPSPPMLFSKASQDVLAERARQINVEGYGDDHDDHYTNGKPLLRAASCYLDHSIFRSWVHAPGFQSDEPPAHWLWDCEDGIDIGIFYDRHDAKQAAEGIANPVDTGMWFKLMGSGVFVIMIYLACKLIG